MGNNCEISNYHFISYLKCAKIRDKRSSVINAPIRKTLVLTDGGVITERATQSVGSPSESLAEGSPLRLSRIGGYLARSEQRRA